MMKVHPFSSLKLHSISSLEPLIFVAFTRKIVSQFQPISLQVDFRARRDLQVHDLDSVHGIGTNAGLEERRELHHQQRHGLHEKFLGSSFGPMIFFINLITVSSFLKPCTRNRRLRQSLRSVDALLAVGPFRLQTGLRYPGSPRSDRGGVRL